MDYWTRKKDLNKGDSVSHEYKVSQESDPLRSDASLEPFDMVNTAFSVNMMHLMGIKPLNTNHILATYGLQNMHYDENKQSEGLTLLDYALSQGAGAVERFTYGSRIASGDSGPCVQLQAGKLQPISIYSQLSSISKADCPKRHVFSNNEEASHAIKKAALLYGADLVGITPFDKNLLYNSEVFMPRDDVTGEILKDHVEIKRKVEFAFTPKNVIVMAYEMDKEAYLTQPSFISVAATTLGYSRMIENSLKLATFIQTLGYNAQHSGNDIGLSVPLAVQAGLGESSRMGLLVTKEFGGRVRLAKVYTDLELAGDKAIEFGVKETCKSCKACSRKCPAGAISIVTCWSDPENKPHNCSNRLGEGKWYNDGQKCLAFWGQQTFECAVCIMTCRYSY